MPKQRLLKLSIIIVVILYPCRQADALPVNGHLRLEHTYPPQRLPQLRRARLINPSDVRLQLRNL